MNHPWLVSVFLFLAMIIVAAGCVGLFTMGSAAARLHFVSATALLAPGLIVLAILIEKGFSQAGIKSILILAVLYLQSPVLAHVIGRAIHSRERLPPVEQKHPK